MNFIWKRTIKLVHIQLKQLTLLGLVHCHHVLLNFFKHFIKYSIFAFMLLKFGVRFVHLLSICCLIVWFLFDELKILALVKVLNFTKLTLQKMFIYFNFVKNWARI